MSSVLVSSCVACRASHYIASRYTLTQLQPLLHNIRHIQLRYKNITVIIRRIAESNIKTDLRHVSLLSAGAKRYAAPPLATGICSWNKYSYSEVFTFLRLEASGWAQLRSAVCTGIASAALPVQRDREWKRGSTLCYSELPLRVRRSSTSTSIQYEYIRTYGVYAFKYTYLY